MKNLGLMKTIVYICCVCFLFIVGCNQGEDDIIPSDTLPVKYTLPQGNERYDSVIYDFYQKNDIYVLYEYGQGDPVWDISSIKGSGAYRFVLPRKEYLEEGVNCMFDLWLNLYPSEFLKGRLPHYIYLADTIYTGSRTAQTLTTTISMTFGNINESLQNMTTTAKNTYKKNINSAFWTYLIDNGRFDVPEALELDYASISSYTGALKAGLIHGSYYRMTLQDDFKKTIEYLMTTSQYMIDFYYRSYPACKTRIGLFVSEMQRLYGIDLETLTDKVLVDK